MFVKAHSNIYPQSILEPVNIALLVFALIFYPLLCFLLAYKQIECFLEGWNRN